MKYLIILIAALAVMMQLRPVFAKASEPGVTTTAHPISDLIGDWPHFHAAILAKTKRYDKYNDIKRGRRILPATLQGTWRMTSNPAKSDYPQHAVLNLGPDQKFTYHLVFNAGKSQQVWDLSGQWEEKNHILMLLVDHSSYPGVDKHQILFWRLLHVEHGKLLFVRSGADELVSMRRAT